MAATNNHFKGQSVVSAIDLKRLMHVKNAPVPEELAKAYPISRAGLRLLPLRSAK